MKLSRTVAYAVQATLELAELGSEFPVPCSRLAAEGNMPSRFLLQILRRLVAHGILQSSLGVDGGYALTRAPNELSLLELIEAVDGPLVLSLSPGDALPAASKAKLEQVLSGVTRHAREGLGAIMLSDLLPEPCPMAEDLEAASSSD